MGRKTISFLAFPLVMGGALTATLLGLQHGGAAPGVVFGTMAGVIVALIVLERWLPYEAEWNRPRGDIGTDILHMLLTQLSLHRILDALLLSALVAGAIAIEARVGGALWPTGWPLALQLFFALLVTDLGRYWLHRASHRIPFLWRFHAVHHSPERLYWLNAGRFHPADETLHSIAVTLPLVLAGAGPEVLALYFVFSGVHGMFQHANIDVRLGPLNYLFSMAELHRWHHSRRIEEAESNYGNNLIWWDILFGTFYNPSDRRASTDVGIDRVEMPGSYWGQLLAPLRWKRHSRKREESVSRRTNRRGPLAPAGSG